MKGSRSTLENEKSKNGRENRVTYPFKMNSNELIDGARDLHTALAFIEQLRGGSALRAPTNNLRELIDSLIRGVPYIGHNLDKLQLFRGRIVNDQKTLSSPKEFGYLPADRVNNYGRCHRPKTAMFYGSNNLDTVLSELTPEIGDLVHVGVASVKPEHELIVTCIGEIDHVRRHDRAILGNSEAIDLQNKTLSKLDENDRVRALLVDAFFADLFAAPAAKQRDYRATAVLAELIFDMKTNTGAQLFDGFAYPSVGHRGGVNLAVLPDSFDRSMDWEQFMAFEISDYLGFGLYGRKQYAQSSKVDENGEIEWKFADQD